MKRKPIEAQWQAWSNPQAPAPTEQPAPPLVPPKNPEESPLDKARRLREEAYVDVQKGFLDDATDELDEAKVLDPPGEDDARVKKARDDIQGGPLKRVLDAKTGVETLGEAAAQAQADPALSPPGSAALRGLSFIGVMSEPIDLPTPPSSPRTSSSSGCRSVPSPAWPRPTNARWPGCARRSPTRAQRRFDSWIDARCGLAREAGAIVLECLELARWRSATRR